MSRLLMSMKNEFANVFSSLEDFKISEIPEDRLFYKNSVKQIIKMGEDLDRIHPDLLAKSTILMLKKHVEEYKIYPNLDESEE